MSKRLANKDFPRTLAEVLPPFSVQMRTVLMTLVLMVNAQEQTPVESHFKQKTLNHMHHFREVSKLFAGVVFQQDPKLHEI